MQNELCSLLRVLSWQRTLLPCECTCNPGREKERSLSADEKDGFRASGNTRAGWAAGSVALSNERRRDIESVAVTLALLKCIDVSSSFIPTKRYRVIVNSTLSARAACAPFIPQLNE